MIAMSAGQLAGLLAMVFAAGGLPVLAICVWRITGKLDDAYEQGYADCEAATPRPAAVPAAVPLRPLPDLSPASGWLTGELARIRDRGQAIIAGLALTP